MCLVPGAAKPLIIMPRCVQVLRSRGAEGMVERYKMQSRGALLSLYNIHYCACYQRRRRVELRVPKLPRRHSLGVYCPLLRPVRGEDQRCRPYAFVPRLRLGRSHPLPKCGVSSRKTKTQTIIIMVDNQKQRRRRLCRYGLQLSRHAILILVLVLTIVIGILNSRPRSKVRIHCFHPQ